MQRKSFLQQLTTLGAFSFLPAKALKHYKKLYLLQCFVAGFRYYKGMDLLAQMKEGDQLELVREPGNEFDRCAIALHWNNDKIGFLPAADNEILSRLLDAQALELVAEITHLNKQVQPWENLSVAVGFLREVTLGAVPDNMEYLTMLETPHYTSYKRKDDTVIRVMHDSDPEETDDDWYGFLDRNSKNDKIYDIIHQSDVKPGYNYSEETGAYLLLNKKRMSNDTALQQLAAKAEDTLGTLDNLFDEDGYVVVTTREAAALVPKLERIVNVTDKLGRHFIELGF